MKRKGLKKTRSSLFVIGAASLLLICGGLYSLWILPYRLSPEETAATATARASLPTFDLFGTSDTACLGSTDPEISRIEEVASLKLPLSTQHVLTHTAVSMNDCTVYVRFEMSPDDLTTFLSSTYVSELKPKPGSSISFDDSVIDWSFDAETEYLYGEGDDGKNLEYHTIIIDTRDPETYIVYVQTFLR